MIDVKTGTEKTPTGGPYVKPMSVILSEKVFEDYKRGDRGNWAAHVREDREFVDSVQWKDRDKKVQESKGKPANSINVVKPGIEQIVNQLVANSPRFMSFGGEKSDVTTASYVSDLMSYSWYKSYGDLKLKAAAKDFEITGMMAMMVYIDPNADFGKGEILITDIDPDLLYVSPHCKDPMTEDSPHKLIVQKYSGEEIQMNGWLTINELGKAARMEDTDEPSSERTADIGQVMYTDDVYEDTYRVIDRYTKVLKPFFRVFDTQSKSFFEKLLTEDEYIEFSLQPAFIKISQNGLDYAVREDEVRNVQKIFDKTGGTFHLMMGEQGPQVMAGEEHVGAILGSTTKLEQVTIAELLQNEVLKIESVMLPRIQRVLSVGGVLVTDTILPISEHCIKTQMLYHNRNPYPYGDVRLVKPLQETLNKLNSLVLTNATMATGPKIIIGTNTADKVKLEKEWTQVGLTVIEIDLELPEAKPIIVYPGTLSNELYAYMGSIRGDIERMMGAYSFQDGDVANAPPTVGGIAQMDEFGNRKSAGKRNDIEKMIDGLGRVYLDYMPHVYTERKVIQLLAPNDVGENTVVFNEWDEMAGKMLNDITVGDYHLRMESGSMLPINRAVRRDYYLQLWDKNVLKDPSVILRESEIPHVEEIIAKQDREAQQAQALEQAEEAIKNLKGQLQSKSRELISANEKVEVEKTKQKMITSANKVEANVALTTARLRDLEKKVKEQLLSNTKTARSKVPQNGN